MRPLLFGSCLALALAAGLLSIRAADATKPDGINPNLPRVVQADVTTEQKTKRSMAQGKQIGLALKLYASDNDGSYPAKLDALVPDYIDAENMKKLLVSPFALGEAVGYKYYPGLTDAADPKSILLEDKFATEATGKRIIIHLDDSAEAIQ